MLGATLAPAIAAPAIAAPGAGAHETERLTPCACIDNADLNETTIILNATTIVSNWTAWSPAGSSASFDVDSTRAYAGRNSLVVHGGHGAWSTRLRLGSGAPASSILRLGFWYRAELAADESCGRVSASLTRGPASATWPSEANITVSNQKVALLCYGATLQGGGWMEATLTDVELPAAASGSSAEEEAEALYLSLWLDSELEPASLWLSHVRGWWVSPPPTAGNAVALQLDGAFEVPVAVWGESASHKVYSSPTASPRPLSAPAPSAELAAAQGERAAMQIVVTPKRGAPGSFYWEVAELKAEFKAEHMAEQVGEQMSEQVGLSESSIPASSIVLKRVEEVKVHASPPYGTTATGPSGLAPDPLVRWGSGAASPFAFVPVNTPFWVGVSVPPLTPPGSYAGKLSLCHVYTNTSCAALTLRVAVFNFSLPEKPSVVVRSRFNAGAVLGAGGNLSDYYEEVRSHRAFTGPEASIVFVPDAEGNLLSTDTAEFEAHLDMLGRGRATQSDYLMPLTYFNARAIQNRANMSKVLGLPFPVFTDDSDLKALSPQFAHYFAECAAVYRKVFDARGIPPHMLLYKPTDEPSPVDPRTIDALVAVLRFARILPYFDGVRIRISGDVIPRLLPYVDTWDQNAGTAHLFGTELGEARKAVRPPRAKCNAARLGAPPRRRRHARARGAPHHAALLSAAAGRAALAVQ